MDTPQEKTCSQCGLAKSLDNFARHKGGKYGKAAQCKDCKSAYKKAWTIANAERIRLRNKLYNQEHAEEQHAKGKVYREKNKGKIQAKNKRLYEKQKAEGTRWQDRFPEQKRASDRASYAKNIEKRQAYRVTNRDKRNQQAKEWAERNADHLVAYRITNRERDAKRIAQWAKDHPNAEAEHNQRRRAAKENAEINDLTDQQFEETQEAQDHRCYYCKKRCKGKLTRDHITPLSQGGNHTLHNVIAVCRSCNSRKGRKPPPIPVQPMLLTIAPAKPFKKKGS